MIIELGELVLYIALALALYSFLHLRLARAVQPLRLELGELGEKMLSNSNLSAHHRIVIEFMLNQAYNRWILILVIIFTPFIWLQMMLSKKQRRKSREMWTVLDPDLKRDIETIDRLFLLSVYAANPFLAVIFGIERFTLSLITVLLRASLEDVEVATDKAFEYSRKRSVGHVHAT